MKFLLIIFDGEDRRTDRHFKHIGSYFQYEITLNLVINLISKNYLNLTLINFNETYF